MLKESIKEQLESIKSRIDGEVKSRIADLQQTLNSKETFPIVAQSQLLEVRRTRGVGGKHWMSCLKTLVNHHFAH